MLIFSCINSRKFTFTEDSVLKHNQEFKFPGRGTQYLTTLSQMKFQALRQHSDFISQQPAPWYRITNHQKFFLFT